MNKHRFSYSPLTAGKHEVGIAGDFTAWEIVPLEDIGGVYVLTLSLPAGVYRYKFIVDGFWIFDEGNPKTEADPFGGFNSVLTIQEAQPRLTWQDAIQLSANKKAEDFLKIIRYGDTCIELRLSWYCGLADFVVLHLADRDMPLSRIGRTSLWDVYYLQLPATQLISFYLETIYQNQRLYLGANGWTTDIEYISPIDLDTSAFPLFSLPDWVSKGIIYQIFPDRFCNGDSAKNPNFAEWYYHDCKTPPPQGELLPPEREYYHFTDNWNDISGLKQSPYLPEGKPDWWSFYGGDIAGVASKLDYLSDLGINIIYFNPLWQAKSNHKYDSADYKSIDPHFATTPEMIEFVAQAHKRGIRIILDVAFNHTGETFWAFRDCVEKGSASPYWNWYDWKKWPLPKPLPPDFKPKEYYQCWWGIKDMPDLNYDLSRHHPEENAIRHIAEAEPNHALVDYILSAVRWWLTEIDIDGFRLDVPDEVPYWFWELFRKEVKSVKPDAWLVGEIWHDALNWVSPLYFDSVMNYAFFKNPVLDFFILGQIDKDEFIEKIENGLALYPFKALQIMMNMLGSHDTHRIYELSKANLSRLKPAIAFQMCFIGAPHIYYGDEIALGGAKDPDNRRPFNWNWMQDDTACELRAYYQSLIKLRKAYPAFSEGDFCFVQSHAGTICFTRSTPSQSLYCCINYTADAIEIDVPGNSTLVFGDTKHSSKLHAASHYCESSNLLAFILHS